MADPSVVCDAAAGPLTSSILLLCAANLAIGFVAGLYVANHASAPKHTHQPPPKKLPTDEPNISPSSSSASSASCNARFLDHVADPKPVPTTPTTPLEPDVHPKPAPAALGPDVSNLVPISGATLPPYAPNDPSRPHARARLAALLVYPVQSCAAVAVGQARVTAHGLEHDGRLVVVDFTGRPLTRAKHPALAAVRPAVGDAGALRLSAPGGWDVEFDPRASGPRHDLCGGSAGARTGVDVGDAAADFFAGYLEIAGVRLVRLDEADVSVAQGRAPFMLATEPSRAHVARRVDGGMEMEWFRPNLVVDGEVEPFEEEAWKRIRVGNIEFDMAEGSAGPGSSTETEDAFKSRRDSGASDTPRSWRSSQRRRFGSVVQVGQTVVPDCGHAITPTLGGSVEGSLLRVGDGIEVLDAAEVRE